MSDERLNVTPNRMELFNLKKREKTAVRGHKLLKDKSDEMIRQFMIYIKKQKVLRDEVEKELTNIMQSFTLAKAVSDDISIKSSLMLSSSSLDLELKHENIMSVNVPMIEVKKEEENDLPYAFSSVTSELDFITIKLKKLSNKLIELAETEKVCHMLADEIEKNKRRVNALEYVMIPQIQNTIKFIQMKLDENERASIVRLMKVKDLIKER